MALHSPQSPIALDQKKFPLGKVDHRIHNSNQSIVPTRGLRMMFVEPLRGVVNAHTHTHTRPDIVHTEVANGERETPGNIGVKPDDV